jgi:hypothetical protein
LNNMTVDRAKPFDLVVGADAWLSA